MSWWDDDERDQPPHREALDAVLAELARWLWRFYQTRVVLDAAAYDQADKAVQAELHEAWETLDYFERYPRPLRITQRGVTREIADEEIASLGVGLAEACARCFVVELDDMGAEVMRLRRGRRGGCGSIR
jgi:hypothetical protein